MTNKPRFLIHSDGRIEQIVDTCEDCISRRQAIDKMQELEYEDIKTYGCAIAEGFDGERAIEALCSLPSVQPEADKIEKIITEIEQLTITKGGEDYIRKMSELYSLKIKILQIINKYRN